MQTWFPTLDAFGLLNYSHKSSCLTNRFYILPIEKGILLYYSIIATNETNNIIYYHTTTNNFNTFTYMYRECWRSIYCNIVYIYVVPGLYYSSMNNQEKSLFFLCTTTSEYWFICKFFQFIDTKKRGEIQLSKMYFLKCLFHLVFFLSWKIYKMWVMDGAIYNSFSILLIIYINVYENYQLFLLANWVSY